MASVIGDLSLTTVAGEVQVPIENEKNKPLEVLYYIVSLKG